MTDFKAIPYGIMNFYDLRASNFYYIDKTKHLPIVEQSGRFLFFIRPRRMGKSLWMSMMEHYYDINYKDEFKKIFGGTWIYDHPTDEQGNYLDIK